MAQINFGNCITLVLTLTKADDCRDRRWSPEPGYLLALCKLSTPLRQHRWRGPLVPGARWYRVNCRRCAWPENHWFGGQHHRPRLCCRWKLRRHGERVGCLVVGATGRWRRYRPYRGDHTCQQCAGQPNAAGTALRATDRLGATEHHYLGVADPSNINRWWLATTWWWVAM